MRTFPTAFESQKVLTFYPAKPEQIGGDILEIGPGRGDFLLSMAGQCPDKRFVAVELAKKRFYKLIPRIERRGLSNILLINGNAGLIIPELISAETFEKIYVLFPDPWPKRRHIPHRLMSISFIEHLTRILKPGGDIFAGRHFLPIYPTSPFIIRHIMNKNGAASDWPSIICITAKLLRLTTTADQ